MKLQPVAVMEAANDRLDFEATVWSLSLLASRRNLMSGIIPLGLRTAIEAGNCVLFIGSGIGFNVQNTAGERGPVGNELRDLLANEYEITIEPDDDLASISQLIEIQHSRKRLIRSVEKYVTGFEPDENLRWLLSLRWRAIFTTNYDQIIERTHELDPTPVQRFISFGANSEVQEYTPPTDIPVVHLHGSFATEAARDAILLTQSDYADASSKREMLFDRLRTEFPTTPILYYGYSNKDPNWRALVGSLRKAFQPNDPPISYRLTPQTSDNERAILGAMRIDSLDMDLAAFRASCEALWSGPRPETTDALKSLSIEGIPSKARSTAEDYKVPMVRLLNSWEYVDGAPFDTHPNTNEFYKGDEPNWAIFGKGVSFERDLEKVLVERLIDWATDPRTSVRAELVLGPAGYGTSTLLRAVAAWYVQNDIGSTLWLRSSAKPTTGDIEFALKHLPGPIIFIIDDAADVSEELDEIVQFIRDSKLNAFILMGSRLNEWRQTRKRFRPYEHELGTLSEDEIKRLLESLRLHGALGKLGGLDSELQFNAIRQRNGKDLLVTLREATEGKAFDAIIEDEYLGIHDARAQELYALVCAFSRVGTIARDQLCGDICEMNVLDVHDYTKASLSGVVKFHTINDRMGLDGLKARHRIIADIVWNRCLHSADRQRVLLSAVDRVNLTYSVDAKAFESFTRDDVVVDSLDSFTAKSDFFERACRRAPDNPYIRQHYARMLRRERKLEAALAQVDAALKIAPNVRSIQHTRGMVLGDLALEASTEPLGRRRLAQGEDAFKQAIHDNERDEYPYRSLADLYLKWARYVSDSKESVLYAAKAQEVISAGMEKADTADGLFVAMADIEDFLGDSDARLAALRSAVAENPENSTARTLLGRHLLKHGEYAQALDVFREGLLRDPSNVPLALGHGLTQYESGMEPEAALASVELARINGLRLPRYCAILGGLYCLSDNLVQAELAWKTATEKNWPPRERYRIHFRPQRGGVRMERKGVVVKVGSGFAVIRDSDFGDVHCSGSLYGGLVMRRGLEVTYEVAFCAVGPSASAVRASE